MDERSYQGILQRRRELQEELRAINDIIHGYERLQQLRAGSEIREFEAMSAPSEPRRRERNVFPPRHLANLARSEILRVGRPMTRGELVAAFEASGIPLAGKDKPKNIGTIMWRFRDEFLNVPGQGYWPKDVPNEAVEGAASDKLA
ncbi:hypothetical protein SAMN02799622_02032 [Methylobacterium sp. UNC378MF]|uniref:hypothetical protein n=1 Tax=Methylobacterium sp. UNC378MF TaxID=1502748 RepID=UPI00088D836F|nr:hypothetical protein [Methylobacterium sp. UNC378MF]SDA18445.1 hypothetical protein SAMN02799622_02032 [Methylobacterium sp. UNC378MF]